MLSLADFRYPIKASDAFESATGFDLSGAGYVPSTMHYENSSGDAFFAFESHKALELQGVMVRGADGHYRPGTVGDLLLLVKTATLEFDLGNSATTAKLVITRLVDTGGLLKSCQRTSAVCVCMCTRAAACRVL
jgi:hypothetical protein